MAVKWTAEQQKVIDTRDRNLLVSAAAGSGKSTLLNIIGGILAMVKDPVRPIDVDQLLVVTFTRAAAGEMKERIGRALQQSLEEDPEDEHLQRQQTLLHHAQISTIHGFCSYVIKNYFQMIDLDPVYRMADEGDPSDEKRCDPEGHGRTLYGKGVCIYTVCGELRGGKAG